LIKNIITIIILLLLASCYSTKHLTTEDQILVKNIITINNQKNERLNQFSIKEIDLIIKQKPNKKIIGLIPFHVWVYNLSDPVKNNWINTYLRRVGEAPIILEKQLVKKSVNQITSYFENNGYFTSNVNTNTIYKNQKAYVEYIINTGDSYLINTINYNLSDNEEIKRILEKNIETSNLNQGDIFTYNALNQERERIETLLQNNGYYKFSKDLIYIKADSSNDKLVNVEFDFQKESDKSRNYEQFHINDVVISLGKNQEQHDTLRHNDYNFIKKKNDDLQLKLDIISELIKIKPHDQYCKNNINKTYQNLSNLQFFKKIKIEFSELKNTNLINCNIYLENPTKMYYSIEAEAKRSADEGNFGVSSYLQFGNNNLFKGAENLNGKIKISLSNRQAGSDNNQLFNTQEISYEIGIRKPKLILPKQLHKWLANSFQMNTSFTFSFTQRKRPDFSSNIITQQLGYNWKSTNQKHHQLNLIELSFSQIEENDFISNLIENNIYLSEQFEDKFIPAINYIFTFHNQTRYKISNYTYFKSKIETSGNLFQILGQTNNLTKNENDDYTVFNNTFSQYGKINLDLRRYLMFSKENTLALRTFFGVGYAYGNSEKMPIQKQFFSGGVNSIRAWEAFTLGPGSSTTLSANNYSTGDLKLEFNIEYRFEFLNSLKSALFIDGGNIWLIENNGRLESTFKFNKFMSEIALGAGVGFRYDVDFFVIRMDIATILKDPSQSEGERWTKNPLNGNFRYNLAIGYPF